MLTFPRLAGWLMLASLAFYWYHSDDVMVCCATNKNVAAIVDINTVNSAENEQARIPFDDILILWPLRSSRISSVEWGNAYTRGKVEEKERERERIEKMEIIWLERILIESGCQYCKHGVVIFYHFYQFITIANTFFLNWPESSNCAASR